MPVELGVNVGLAARNAEADCALAAKMGFRWVRTSQEMHWTADRSITNLRTFATAARNQGLRLIQCCQGMPANLARGSRAGHYGPKNDSAAREWGEWFAQCAEIVVTTNGVTSCLNEPDGYGWDTTPSAADCATLHAAALEARDDLVPTAIFATGEMAPGSNPEPLAFLKQIVAFAPTVLDHERCIIGWHNYTDPRYPADFNALWNTNHRMRDVHDWLVDQGHPKMKIMGGEWAIANGPAGNPRSLSTGKVADYVRTQYLPSFERMKADGVKFGPLVWYCLRDGPASSNWADWCGLVDSQGNPKPVAGVLQAYNEGTL